MKIIITILAFLNGSYMLLDGIFVMLKGKYIGPEKPGPWANIFYKLGINVFKLGPLFIVSGMLWFTFIYALFTNQNWAFIFGVLISVLSLWYLPIGTFISLIIMLILFLQKKD